MTALQQLRLAVRQLATQNTPSQSGDDLPAAATVQSVGIAAAIELACWHEVRAPKLGNVHPGAAFDDCDVDDFRLAGQQIAPILAATSSPTLPHDLPRDLGDRVLAAVQATRSITPANVNLGIILLIAPLAAVTEAAQIGPLLRSIDHRQTETIYRAIALAKPGGVRADQVPAGYDVTRVNNTVEPLRPTIDLIAAMQLAADRDRIALQYADAFRDFFGCVVPMVQQELLAGDDIDQAIVRAQLRLLAAAPDSLIGRKCGPQIAAEAQRRAADCWQDNTGWRDTDDGQPGAIGHQRLDPQAIEQLDRWLRDDGNRRNPGTTADLIAAALFWLIRP